MIRILLADDHAMFRAGLRGIIEQEFEMLVAGEAADGQEVMRKILAEDYDVVILDINMPGRDGIEVLSEIKTAKPNVAVLILSMYSEEQFALRALRAGASGYLTKESAPVELTSAIRTVVQGSKYISAAVAQILAYGVDARLEKLSHEKLSDREYGVMLQITSGKKINEIAAELNLSPKTISTYRARLLEKMGMETNAELTQYAIRHRLLK